MKNFSLGTAIDGLLTLVCGFLLCFIILNYFCPAPYSHILASALAILLALSAGKISYSRFLKRGNKRAKTKEAELVLNQLDFLPADKISTLFFDAFTADGKTPIKKRAHLYLPQTKTLVFFSFGFKSKTKADIVRAYNLLQQDERALILGTEFPSDVLDFARRFGGRISLIFGQPVYALLKKHDNLPKITCPITTTDAKPKLPKFFRKKNAKSFLTFGILFLIMSYLVPLKVYYIVMGGIMLVFGFILLIFGSIEENE